MRGLLVFGEVQRCPIILVPCDTPGFTVAKKLKDKGFARTVNRQDVYRGAEELGRLARELDMLVANGESDRMVPTTNTGIDRPRPAAPSSSSLATSTPASRFLASPARQERTGSALSRRRLGRRSQCLNAVTGAAMRPDHALLLRFRQHIHHAPVALGPITFSQAMHQAHVDVIHPQFFAEPVKICPRRLRITSPGLR